MVLNRILLCGVKQNFQITIWKDKEILEKELVTFKIRITKEVINI